MMGRQNAPPPLTWLWTDVMSSSILLLFMLAVSPTLSLPLETNSELSLGNSQSISTLLSSLLQQTLFRRMQGLLLDAKPAERRLATPEDNEINEENHELINEENHELKSKENKEPMRVEDVEKLGFAAETSHGPSNLSDQLANLPGSWLRAGWTSTPLPSESANYNTELYDIPDLFTATPTEDGRSYESRSTLSSRLPSMSNPH